MLAALRQVNFHRKSDGQVSMHHGQESLGRSVEDAVQGASEIPEEFTVSVEMYSNPGVAQLSRVDVRIGVYLDVSNQKVELRVLGDEFALADQAVQDRLGTALRDGLGKIPVFHGRHG